MSLPLGLPPAAAGHPDDPLLKTREVAHRCRVTPRTIRAWVAAGRFPPPLRLSPRCIRWPLSVVDRHLAGKEALHAS